ncbi:hypothetical protein [Undibacterium sp.]|uniref:hypothetical protein n=1 Tax=Undibacterium sp. TaxID=1914977 RepID=UPI00374DBD2E
MFVFRAAGVVSINFTLEREGKTIWQGKIEKVVTDEDAEYSGSQISSHDSAMMHVMADSLRMVLKELLPQLQTAAKASG